MAPISEVTENGKDYRIILEQANLSHPEGSVVAVFAISGKYEKIWEYAACVGESDADLFQKARVQAKGHASKS